MGKKYLAIILAAGRGSRLYPLTGSSPKPLVKVNGKPILFHALDCLKEFGIDRCVIAIGYKGDFIRRAVDSVYSGKMHIRYIINDKFERTNNSYTLWLMREYLRENDCILIEGDVMFDRRILSINPAPTGDGSCWIVDKFRKGMNGALLSAGKSGRINGVRILKDPAVMEPRNGYKSVGILKIKRDFGWKLSKWLDDEVDAGNINIYYDLVIAKHLPEVDFSIGCVGGFKWCEIDDANDLERARNMFGER